MKLLIFCLLAVVVSTTGVILCDGVAKQIFQVGFFCSLGLSFVMIVIGQFN